MSDKPQQPECDRTSTATCRCCGYRTIWGGPIDGIKQTFCHKCGITTWHDFHSNPAPEPEPPISTDTIMGQLFMIQYGLGVELNRAEEMKCRIKGLKRQVDKLIEDLKVNHEIRQAHDMPLKSNPPEEIHRVPNEHEKGLLKNQWGGPL